MSLYNFQSITKFLAFGIQSFAVIIRGSTNSMSLNYYEMIFGITVNIFNFSDY